MTDMTQTSATAAPSEVLTGIWSDLVGQEKAVASLKRAVEGDRHAMTHAWLITGPPGSGRSNTARAFAAALQCPDGGCGDCTQCRTAISGAHPDVTLVRTDKLSIGVAEIRDLVRRAAMSPSLGQHQVLVVEDSDRMTEQGANALLKSIEEPAPRTVWLLCAPTVDDVVPTIRSRCRLITLRTPATAAVAHLLVDRDGIDPVDADRAARAAQGHIGRARLLARDADIWARRREILTIPYQLRGLAQCLTHAQRLVETSAADAAAATAALDETETAELSESLGMGTRGIRARNAQAALKELADQQKARQKRYQRDALDQALTELTAYYRDVLAVQTGSQAELVNIELLDQITEVAGRDGPDQTVRRIDAILGCRTALEGNVAPLLAVEALLVRLVDP